MELPLFIAGRQQGKGFRAVRHSFFAPREVGRGDPFATVNIANPIITIPKNDVGSTGQPPISPGEVKVTAELAPGHPPTATPPSAEITAVPQVALQDQPLQARYVCQAVSTT